MLATPNAAGVPVRVGHHRAKKLRMLRGEVQPQVSARDGLANLRVTGAIVAAARSGGLVEAAV